MALLVVISLTNQTERSPVPLLLVQKVAYTWEDVMERISSASGVDFTKTENVLSMRDELPAAFDVPTYVGRYVSFVQQFYSSSDVAIKFYSSEGEEITDFSCFGKQHCNDDEVQFHILPFNMTYAYPDWSKRLLDVICYATSREGFPACDFSAQSLEVEINLTGINFSCNPSVYNDCTTDDIEWNNDFDKVFGCTSGVGCIPYSLTIRDNSSRVYACQGVYGGNSGNTKRVNCDASTLNWFDDKEAKLTIKASPCNAIFKFGKHGRFRAEGKTPSEGDCDAGMATNVQFVFNTTDFWTDFSTQLEVRDTFVNYSVKTAVR